MDEWKRMRDVPLEEIADFIETEFGYPGTRVLAAASSFDDELLWIAVEYPGRGAGYPTREIVVYISGKDISENEGIFCPFCPVTLLDATGPDDAPERSADARKWRARVRAVAAGHIDPEFWTYGGAELP